MNDQPKRLTDTELADAFTRLLTLEKIEEDFFRGIATPRGRGRAFGGQVIAQALMAASNTVEPERRAHSLHAYFMRPGDAEKPVLYDVREDFSGRSFATRRVVAIQNGKPILNLAASFHFAEDGYHHQEDMPKVPPPEDLLNEEQLAEKYDKQLPEQFKKFLRWNRPVELRPVGLRAPFVKEKQDPVAHVWIKAKGVLGDDPALHRAALAFTSDMGLLSVSMMPHGKGFSDPDMQFASIDHAIWLHDDFRMDEWLLYVMESPWSGGARGFNRGRIYTRDGRMIANVAQEGLTRHIKAKPE